MTKRQDKGEEFGRIIEEEHVQEPQFYARMQDTGVEVAIAQRDHGPIAPLRSVEITDSHGRRKRLPPKRVIEILRHEHDGEAVEVQVVVSTVREMYRRHRLTVDQYREAVAFKRNFDIGRLDALRIPSIDRIPSGGGAAAVDTDSIIDAKDEVHRLMKIVGGEKTSMGKALWNIVGREVSLRQLAVDNGREYKFWGATLINALELLVEHNS